MGNAQKKTCWPPVLHADVCREGCKDKLNTELDCFFFFPSFAMFLHIMFMKLIVNVFPPQFARIGAIRGHYK